MSGPPGQGLNLCGGRSAVGRVGKACAKEQRWQGWVEGGRSHPGKPADGAEVLTPSGPFSSIFSPTAPEISVAGQEVVSSLSLALCKQNAEGTSSLVRQLD